MTLSTKVFVDALPKVELHLHLVGSASPRTTLELARRHPGGPVPSDEAALRKFYEFRDSAHFIEAHDAVVDLVRDPEDIALIVRGLARDLARQNVRYAEVTVTPYAHVRRGMPAREVTAALDEGRRRAYAETGVRLAWVFDIAGELGAEAARGTLDHALEHPPEALVGFGLGGIEVDRAQFREEFKAARAAGLHSVPHAGEWTGPEAIWSAINDLGAERIGHGVRCVEDPRLVAHLRETRIPLEVCPTSNVCTRVVPSLAQHPLPRMIDAGLNVTLNSDDPPMFDTDLANEYRAVAGEFGLGVAELADLARAGVRASFLDEAGRERLIEEIDAVVRAHAD